eukprot:1140939-Pelagomonas_calceolata.AAC.3
MLEEVLWGCDLYMEQGGVYKGSEKQAGRQGPVQQSGRVVAGTSIRHQAAGQLWIDILRALRRLSNQMGGSVAPEWVGTMPLPWQTSCCWPASHHVIISSLSYRPCLTVPV